MAKSKLSKEQAYDAKVFPLMAQIIAICKEHKIPMLASFTLDKDESLQCTTALLEDEWEPHECLQRAFDEIYRKRSNPMFITVRDGDGKVKSMEAIV